MTSTDTTTPTKKPWYLRWWGIALIALFFIGFLMTIFEDDEEAEVADALEEIDIDAGGVQDATGWPDRPEPAEEPEPEPEPEPTHDWASTDAYIEDMYESSEDVAELLGLVGETANMYGQVPDEEIASAFDMAAFVISTHIDHFEGSTPPPGFEESQRLMLEAWTMFQDSWTMAASATRADDPGLLMDAVELMEQGTAKVGEATSALPD